jgi:uncharacterized protein
MDFGPYRTPGPIYQPVSMAPLTLQVLTYPECLALLASETVGRVGTNVSALPVVLPVNFVLDSKGVVFRTVEGTKFHAATAGAVLAFEVDGYDETAMTGWSVLVQGVGQVVTDLAECAGLEASGLQAWALDGRADRWVRIPLERLSGRRFAP